MKQEFYPMNPLKIILPVAFALVAAAPTIAAPSTRFACTDLNDAYWLAGMADGSYKAHKVRQQLKADGACFDVRRAVVDHKYRSAGAYTAGPTTTTAGFGVVSSTTGPSTQRHSGGAYSCVRSNGTARGCMWAVD
jgi:hypothetical protein